MFELIIILSLAIIFFIFLIRMPEIEKIDGKIEGKRPPLFKHSYLAVFKNSLDKIRGIRLHQAKTESPEIEPLKPKESETRDIFLEAERKLKFGDLEAAEKLYLRLAIISPNDATIYAALGKIYFERQNFKDSISSFKAAIHRDPKNGFYYYDLGTALFKAERFDEAIICFEKSVLINNRIPIRHLGLGLSLMKMGEYERAASSFRRAIQIEPNNEKYKRFLKKAESKNYSSSLN